MSLKDSTANQSGGTTAGPTGEHDLPAAIEPPFVPRDIAGGVVIEAAAFERTADGALRFAGSAPTHVVGLCSEQKVRDALRDDGHSHDEIDAALAHGARFEDDHPANANAAIAAAEHDAVRAMTDGGRPDGGRDETDEFDAAAELAALDLREGERFDHANGDQMFVSQINNETVEFSVHPEDRTAAPSSETWVAGKLVHHLDAGKVERVGEDGEDDDVDVLDMDESERDVVDPWDDDEEVDRTPL